MSRGIRGAQIEVMALTIDHPGWSWIALEKNLWFRHTADKADAIFHWGGPALAAKP